MAEANDEFALFFTTRTLNVSFGWELLGIIVATGAVAPSGVSNV